MKLRRGIVVFDKFQGYLDDMSAVFEPVKLSAGDENGLPSRILFHFLFQRADSVLKTAQSDFVRGRLIESLGGFRESLRIVALASVNCEDDTSVIFPLYIFVETLSHLLTHIVW